MLPVHFLLEVPGLRILECRIESDAIRLRAETTSPTAPCPVCGQASHRGHSRYPRTLADRPLGRRPLVLRVNVRRFRCLEPHCPRTVFGERLGGLAPPYARTTTALTEAHTAIGFAAGGEPGARRAEALAMPTSPDTVLRRVRAAKVKSLPPPRYVGIDDWACKKGQIYGTILIDLERRQVIDLLPGRDGEALTAWLRNNPQVEVITRDRWSAYATAATAAAPQALQVADRWHLLKNLREAVENLIARFGPDIRVAAAALSEPAAPPADDAPGGSEPAPEPDPQSARVSARAAKRQARMGRRARARELRGQGWSIRDIARQMAMSPKTVLRVLRHPDRPHGNLGRRGPSALDRYRGEIEAWMTAGGTNTAALYRVLRAAGCRASYDAVRRFANRRLGSSGKPGRRSPTTPRPVPAPDVPSARKLSSQFAGPKAAGESDGPSFLDRVRAQIPGLDAALTLAGELADMIRKRVTRPLVEWVAKAAASGVPELVGFAAGLRADEAAVSAALTETWSNGPVEGQVNRLKAIKRSMYGRAGMDLLRARVMHKGERDQAMPRARE
jgi:transposase